jgi:hypothetical protein
MGAPHLFQISELMEFTSTVAQRHPDLGLIPTRPMCWPGLALRRRLKVAWGVFTGKYDAVFWEPTLKQLKFDDPLPSKVDLRDKMPPVDDTGDVNASASAAVIAAVAATGLEMPGITPYMYYNQKHVNEHERTVGG